MSSRTPPTIVFFAKPASEPRRAEVLMDLPEELQAALWQAYGDAMLATADDPRHEDVWKILAQSSAVRKRFCEKTLLEVFLAQTYAGAALFRGHRAKGEADGQIEGEPRSHQGTREVKE